ncbi:MAG: hypothetical protein GY865_02140, partial [candidate division Zixibacteria bacterium]|nr:hypothetical protein [candidate division Zixibacteria bacterium]
IGYITSSSPTESEYNRIMDSYNFSQRQEIANKSLKYIVNIEKKRRLSRGVLSLALGIAYGMIQPIQTSDGKNSFINPVLSFLNIGVAFSNFFSLSPTEKILRQYNKNPKLNNSLKVQIRSNYSNELQFVLFKQF